jgi:hypothetical protein
MPLASAQRRPKSNLYTVPFLLLSLFLALTLLLDTSELGTSPRSFSYAVRSALCHRSVVFCLPHVSSRPRLKRYDDHATFTEPIISTHFYRDRPRCRELYRAPRREPIPSRVSPSSTRDVWCMLRSPSKSSNLSHSSADLAGSSKSVSPPSARTVRTTHIVYRRATHKPIYLRVRRHHRDRIPSRRSPRHPLCPSLCAYTFHPSTLPFLRLMYQPSLLPTD